MSTVKMTTYHLSNLLEKMTSTDKDYRFMATNDLMSELQKDNIILDDDSEKKVVRMLLKLLEDNNGEVQNLAVRCMGPLVTKVKPDQVENIVECLCTNMLSDKEQLRDISSIGLKTVLTEISPSSVVLTLAVASAASSQPTPNPACVSSPQNAHLPSSIVKKITPRLVAAISREDVAVQLEALDILADLLMRFGPLLVPYHINILDGLEPLLSSSRLAVRKRSIICLAQLTTTCQIALYTRLIDFLLDALESDVSMSAARTYVQSIGAISRSSGHRFGMYLDRVLPLILNFCRAGSAGTMNGDVRAEGEDDELRENCLQACESFTRTCPKSMQPHVDALVDICLQYLVYDPNYNYGDEEEDDDGMDDGRSKESMDWNDEDEVEEEDDDEEYSDDDDMSWKVRRAAAKCLEAIVASDCACLPLFLSKVAPRLISRFKEREENVKVDILHVYTTMLKQFPRAAVMIGGVGSGGQEEEMETEGTQDGPHQLLLAQVPALVRSIQRQMKEKGVRTRQACLLLLTELVTVASGCLDPHIPTLIPGVLYSLLDKSAVSSMRMDTLSFLYRLLCASSTQAFHPHISTLLPPVIQAIGDSFYKITSEALLVTQQMVKVMRPIGVASGFDFTPFVDDIYRATLDRLKASDIDQEVKERAICCMGVILSHMGDRLKSELPTCLPIFLDRLRNEITRLSTVKALNQIASSPLAIDLRPILGDALPILASFLRKNQRALKLSTLLLLNTIVHNYKNALTVQSLHQAMIEFPLLLNESDLHIAQLTLSLLTSIGSDHKQALADIERFGILNEVRNLLRSPLLQGSALEAMLSFFRTLVAAQLPGLGFAALLNSLFQFVQNPGQGTLNRQANHNIAKCVSALVMVDPREALAVVNHLLGDIKRPKSDSIHVFALLTVGEIGRNLDLSPVPAMRETLLENLSAPSEEVKGAASYAIGLSSLSNLNVSVPFLLSEIRGGVKRQYLLLHALKEVIVNQSTSAEGIAALRPFVSDVWALLFAHAETPEEGMRNVVAECLGRLTLSDPVVLLPELKKQLHHQNAYMRSTLITAIKFTISDQVVLSQPQKIDGLLREHLGDFMVLLDDENLSVRRVALVAFNSAAHNKPLLIRGLLPELLPRLYRETDIRQELIREVEMGPFKHTVDDGLDLRKAAFECMYTLLDSPGLLPHLNLDHFLERVDAGLRDHHDIKMLTYLMLSRMAYLAPHSVLGRLDRLIEPLKNTCTSKARAMSVKQECEKLDELKRAALRVVVALQNIQDADKNPHLNEFMALIMSSKELRELYDTVQRDAVAGRGAGASLGSAGSSLWVHEMDSSPSL